MLNMSAIKQSTSIPQYSQDAPLRIFPPADNWKRIGPRLMIRDNLFHSNNAYIAQDELG